MLEGSYLKIKPAYGYWQCTCVCLRRFPLDSNTSLYRMKLQFPPPTKPTIPCMIPLWRPNTSRSVFLLERKSKNKQNKNWNTKTGVLRHLYCNLIISRSHERFQTGSRWTIIKCSQSKISLLCKKEVYRMNEETVSEAMENIRWLDDLKFWKFIHFLWCGLDGYVGLF